MTRVISVLFFVLSVPSYAIEFWHSNTIWIGQGACAAVFSFDSGIEEIKNLQVSVTAVNNAGKEVASGILEIAHFGESSADRYADAALEGEVFCEEELAIVVNKASAIVANKRIDFLKSGGLFVRDFKPITIRIGK